TTKPSLANIPWPRPPISHGLARGGGIPRQLPPIGIFVLVELAGHADDRGLVVANVFPAVIDTGRNHHQPLISLAQHEFVDATKGRRAEPTVITDDTKRSCRREQAVDRETMNSPRPNSSGERDRRSHLNDRKVGDAPVHPKHLRQVTMMMGNRTREAILYAVYRIEA